jgi:hypothetical protein
VSSVCSTAGVVITGTECVRSSVSQSSPVRPTTGNNGPSTPVLFTTATSNASLSSDLISGFSSMATTRDVQPGDGNSGSGGGSSTIPIGLGVGLGVGIPLTLGVVGFLAFLFWKAKRDGPKPASAPEQERGVGNAVGSSREKPELSAETPRPRHELEGDGPIQRELP